MLSDFVLPLSLLCRMVRTICFLDFGGGAESSNVPYARAEGYKRVINIMHPEKRANRYRRKCCPRHLAWKLDSKVPWATFTGRQRALTTHNTRSNTKKRQYGYVFLQVHEFRSRLQPKTPLRGSAAAETAKAKQARRRSTVRPKEQQPCPGECVHPPTYHIRVVKRQC